MCARSDMMDFYFLCVYQICYVMTAVTVCIRMDVFGVLYVILLALMMLFSRRTSARIWWLYMLILAILLPVQYLMSLGFPAIACVGQSNVTSLKLQSLASLS